MIFVWQLQDERVQREEKILIEFVGMNTLFT